MALAQRVADQLGFTVRLRHATGANRVRSMMQDVMQSHMHPDSPGYFCGSYVSEQSFVTGGEYKDVHVVMLEQDGKVRAVCAYTDKGVKHNWRYHVQETGVTLHTRYRRRSPTVDLAKTSEIIYWCAAKRARRRKYAGLLALLIAIERAKHPQILVEIGNDSHGKPSSADEIYKRLGLARAYAYDPDEGLFYRDMRVRYGPRPRTPDELRKKFPELLVDAYEKAWYCPASIKRQVRFDEVTGRTGRTEHGAARARSRTARPAASRRRTTGR
jgi:hypothetical protein